MLTKVYIAKNAFEQALVILRIPQQPESILAIYTFVIASSKKKILYLTMFILNHLPKVQDFVTPYNYLLHCV
jgi:hypothetical protein